jgi:hypothetical protein
MLIKISEIRDGDMVVTGDIARRAIEVLQGELDSSVKLVFDDSSLTADESERLRHENRLLRGAHEDTEGETGIISRMQEARSYDNQPPLNDGLDDYLWEQDGEDD